MKLPRTPKTQLSRDPETQRLASIGARRGERFEFRRPFIEFKKRADFERLFHWTSLLASIPFALYKTHVKIESF